MSTLPQLTTELELLHRLEIVNDSKGFAVSIDEVIKHMEISDPELLEALKTPSYGEYDREKQLALIESLGNILCADDPSPEVQKDVADSINVTRNAFDFFYGTIDAAPIPTDLNSKDTLRFSKDDGLFAFVLPSRVSRDPANKYGVEGNQVMPILKYCDPQLRQLLIANMCPLVVEKYQGDINGRSGYIIFAPIMPDMAVDLGRSEAIKTSRKIVDDTAEFARHRLGANYLGLGATLPGLTKYGKTVNVEGLTTTTGHAGTVALVLENIERRVESLNFKEQSIGKIAIIGAGAIGSSISEFLSREGLADEIIIYDLDASQARKVAEFIAQNASINTVITIAENLRDVLVDPKVTTIVGAITTPINLNDYDLPKDALDGKYILEDSQPECFDRDQVEQLGGEFEIVTGKDPTPEGIVTRPALQYINGFGPHDKDDEWGCAMETAVLARSNALGYTHNAVSGPVTSEDVSTMRHLFRGMPKNDNDGNLVAA